MIYDKPISTSELRQLPAVSLNPKHKYKKDNAFQTCFMGKLTTKAIERYSLLGRYGSKAQQEATQRLGEAKAKQNVKRAITNILANKYISL